MIEARQDVFDTEPRVVARDGHQKRETCRPRDTVHAEARRTAVDDAQQTRAIEPVDEHRHPRLPAPEPRELNLTDQPQRTTVELNAALVTVPRIFGRRAE